MYWCKFCFSRIINWKKGNLFKSVINKVLKLSELEKTTDGLKIIAFGKLLMIFFSPSSFEIAYLESNA